MTSREILTLALMGPGAAFIVLAALGLLRLPDVYTRMAASSKAGTLGVMLLVAGAASSFDEPSAWFRGLAIVAFLVLTAPVAAHRIGRAAYLTGTRPWEGTQRDDLAGRYDREADTLASPGDPQR